MDIYKFDDYKFYINEHINSLPSKGRGSKKEIAELLNCKQAYVSQVLNGEAHFNLEQADELNLFLNHNQDQARYFLTLVQYARSGTPSLKNHFKAMIKDERNKASRLKNFYKDIDPSNNIDIEKYFSTWEYAYIHVLLTIPKLQDFNTILSYSKLSKKRLRLILDDLCKMNIIEQKAETYKPQTTKFHLPDDSRSINNHHVNWRIKTIESLKNSTDFDLHYSSIISISEDDFSDIKHFLSEKIKSVREKVADSKAEIPCCFSLDFFEIK